MFGRYEYSHGKSHKFWEIRDNGDGTATAQWGRIGTIGQSTIYDHDKACRKAIEKAAKGYRIVGDAEPLLTNDEEQIIRAARASTDWLKDLKKMAGDK